MPDFEDYLNLPEDPELAFVEHEQQLREKMWAAINKSDSTSYDEDRKIEYVTKLMAFHDAYNFSFLTKPRLSRGYDDFDGNFSSFIDEITYWTTQIQVRHSQRLRSISTVLKLTPEIKQQLHSYINRIRETIAPMEISISKKEAILSKLNALANEIDCERTKTEALTALVLELASAGGQAAKELEPIRKFADSIANLLGKSKALMENPKLPAPLSQKQIEGPKKSTEQSRTLHDDEIPF